MSRYAPAILILIGAWFAFGGTLPDWGNVLPIPAVNPIKKPGFAVLMVYESEKLDQYTEAQKTILWAADLRQELNALCSKGETGWPDYRILDSEADMTNDSQWWRDAMATPRTSYPWLVVSGGKKNYDGPLPATLEDARKLIKDCKGDK